MNQYDFDALERPLTKKHDPEADLEITESSDVDMTIDNVEYARGCCWILAGIFILVSFLLTIVFSNGSREDVQRLRFFEALEICRGNLDCGYTIMFAADPVSWKWLNETDGRCTSFTGFVNYSSIVVGVFVILWEVLAIWAKFDKYLDTVIEKKPERSNLWNSRPLLSCCDYFVDMNGSELFIRFCARPITLMTISGVLVQSVLQCHYQFTLVEKTTFIRQAIYDSNFLYD